jgi:EAL domain-containing protein (putative c-di-GMP-specific phosphodiesterase class I)
MESSATHGLGAGQPVAPHTRERTDATMMTQPGDDLCQRVRKGLRAGEFQLAFQGVYHARTGALSSAEALIRWMHPQYGMLLPAAFISAIADPDVASDMTQFVIDSTCSHLASWQREGNPMFPIAVNVPPSVVAEASFAWRLEHSARSHGVVPGLFQVELSEAEDATKILASKGLMGALREIGVRIAIDDFGTGYSSLAMLSALDVDVVKLAKELLATVSDNPRACEVVSAILNLLEKLAVTVVVEGVETAAQAQWLARWPNVLAQGFYYARPMFGLSNIPGCKHAPVKHLQLVG